MDLDLFMYYPASHVIDGGVHCLTVKTTAENIGISTEGATLDEAVAEAQGVLYSMATLCLAHKEPAPAAGVKTSSDVIVRMPADYALKCLLRTLMLKNKISMSELARRLGFKRPQQAFNMLTFEHATSLDKPLISRFDLNLI